MTPIAARIRAAALGPAPNRPPSDNAGIGLWLGRDGEAFLAAYDWLNEEWRHDDVATGRFSRADETTQRMALLFVAEALS